jgi:methylglutamate dehydrogenase subunit D
VYEPAIAARSALGSLARPGRNGNPLGAPGVIIAERTGLGIVSIMARNGMAEAVSRAAEAAFGIALPATPRRVEAGGIAFLWTGPARWLAIAQDRPSEDLAETAARVFSSLASIAEQGDGRAIIRVGGPRARDALAKILGIDLHPRAFRPGDAAVTGAAHLELQLWQLDDKPCYEIALLRGFAESFWHWLLASAADYGCEIAAVG